MLENLNKILDLMEKKPRSNFKCKMLTAKFNLMLWKIGLRWLGFREGIATPPKYMIMSLSYTLPCPNYKLKFLPQLYIVFDWISSLSFRPPSP